MTLLSAFYNDAINVINCSQLSTYKNKNFLCLYKQYTVHGVTVEVIKAV